MSDSKSAWLRASGVIGFLGVALGAFGAHGLEQLLQANDRVDTWETAVLYHLVHAVVLVALALAPGRFRRASWICMAAGIAIFSGTLYALALSNVGVLGAITPIGGVLLLIGWLLLVIRA